MDWRNRKYYCVSFSWEASNMRIRNLKLLDGVKIRPNKDAGRGHYQYLISAPIDCSEAIEYELRKAERNDSWCDWAEISQKRILYERSSCQSYILKR